MKHFINLTSEGGHIVVCPLWKLPQLVAAEVDSKRDDIEACKAQAAAKAKAEAEMEAARAAAAAAESEAVNAPFDISADTGF